MNDKNCPYIAIAPPSLMNMEYCTLKPHIENPDGSYRYVSCTADNWILCKIILEKQRKDLEKELDRF